MDHERKVGGEREGGCLEDKGEEDQQERGTRTITILYSISTDYTMRDVFVIIAARGF